MVSFAFPLEGILASQIPVFSCHQRAFSSKPGLHDRWSKLANGMPSKVREVERKQYGISFSCFQIRSAYPRLTERGLGQNCFPGNFFISQTLYTVLPWTARAFPREAEKGDSWFFREIVQMQPSKQEGALSPRRGLFFSLCSHWGPVCGKWSQA